MASMSIRAIPDREPLPCLPWQVKLLALLVVLAALAPLVVVFDLIERRLGNGGTTAP